MKLIKPIYVNLKNHSQYNERWLQSLLADDASWLGLGDLNLIGSERAQPTGGRLDILLADPDSDTRYTVELQLGKLDESHIIRAIEYWDVERRRYPQLEHIAVIVAEDITSRFLNVISLLHHSIPLIAIQLQAVQVEDALTLVATRVHDYMPPAAPEEEAGPIVDRNWWLQRSSPRSMELTQHLFERVRQIDPGAELRFTRSYIRLYSSDSGTVLVLRPRKGDMVLTEFKVSENEQLTNEIQSSALRADEYDKRHEHYRIRIKQQDFDVEPSASLIERLLRQATGTEPEETPEPEELPE